MVSVTFTQIRDGNFELIRQATVPGPDKEERKMLEPANEQDLNGTAILSIGIRLTLHWMWIKNHNEHEQGSIFYILPPPPRGGGGGNLTKMKIHEHNLFKK